MSGAADILNPTTIVKPEPFDPANLNPEQLIVAFLVHRIASLPKDARGDFASVAAELATCETQEEFREIAETIREIIFPELIGELKDGPMGAADVSLTYRKQLVGAAIKRFREEAGLSQAELAAKAGLTQSHVSRLEGYEHSPSHKTLQKLADALGKKVHDLDVTED